MELTAKRISVSHDPDKLIAQKGIKQHFARSIVQNKSTLWTYFIDADTAPPYGFVNVNTLRICLDAVLIHTPRAVWETIDDFVDLASGLVNYNSFLTLDTGPTVGLVC